MQSISSRKAGDYIELNDSEDFNGVESGANLATRVDGNYQVHSYGQVREAGLAQLGQYEKAQSDDSKRSKNKFTL